MTTKITDANIANTGVTAGSYTYASITVNEQGQVTAAANGDANLSSAAFNQANSAFNQANTATTIGQAAYTQANSAFAQANTATTIGQAAYTQANSAFNQANTATTLANSANSLAQAAYDAANNVTVVAALNDLTDVIITSATTDEILKYDGTNWINGPLSSALGSSNTYSTYTYVGNGSCTIFTVTSGISANDILVFDNGVAQVPNTDYTVTGSNLIFTIAPESDSTIQVRKLTVATVGGGSGSSSNTVIDGGFPDSSYAAITPIDGGTL